MDWIPEAVIEDFKEAAKLAGVQLATSDIEIEKMPAPHVPPSRLPPGKMAVYVFSQDAAFLKVGKVGPC